MTLHKLIENSKVYVGRHEDAEVELNELKSLATANHISLNGFDLNVYHAILPLVLATTNDELQNVNSAKFQVLKLAILFGSYDAVIDYLRRFEKQNPTSLNLIHDASLFILPDDEAWNVHVWRA